MALITNTLDLWKRITKGKCCECGKKIKRNTFYCCAKCYNKAFDKAFSKHNTWKI